jgi:parallel beta-helix repeat protein
VKPLNLLLPILFVSALHAQIVVSPDGPIHTLAAARDRAREVRAAGATGPITVKLHGGAYFLSETLVLGPEDSDTIWEAWPGERPVISGGRVIAGWKKGKGALWVADATGPYFRQLFIGGRRAQRARTPNYGYYRIDGPSSQDKPFLLRFRGNDIRQEWAGRGDVEVIALLAWADLRMPIAAVDEAAHIATLASDPRASNKEVDARYYIENAPDALDAPGEWYLDKAANTVSYWPLPGENLAAEEAIAPAIAQLVRIEGKPEEGRMVQNVIFRGLTFAHADWTMGPKGFADTQAAMPAPAAFEAVGATGAKIEKCLFTNLGGYAVWFSRGSKRNQVVANEMFGLGGGGVKLGDASQYPHDADQNYENLIADNHIHDLGLVYSSAVGIWVLQSGRNQIIYNHVHDLSYSAISVGWTWGYGPNQSNSNLIAYNHLHHIGNDLLSDMGGIYTLGVQPGTIIRNNLIHDVTSFTYGGWGIYPDEGSSGMTIENNIVYNCKSAGFHQHYGRENLVRNNIFAFNRENQLMRTRMEPHVSFTMESNIILFAQGRLLGGNWAGDTFKMNRNVYWDLRGPEFRFGGKSFDEWKRDGQDADSVVADPLFVNAANYDFRLSPNSPALGLGFHPIDVSHVGPRVSPGP